MEGKRGRMGVVEKKLKKLRLQDVIRTVNSLRELC